MILRQVKCGNTKELEDRHNALDKIIQNLATYFVTLLHLIKRDKEQSTSILDEKTQMDIQTAKHQSHEKDQLEQGLFIVGKGRMQIEFLTDKTRNLRNTTYNRVVDHKLHHSEDDHLEKNEGKYHWFITE